MVQKGRNTVTSPRVDLQSSCTHCFGGLLCQYTGQWQYWRQQRLKGNQRTRNAEFIKLIVYNFFVCVGLSVSNILYYMTFGLQEVQSNSTPGLKCSGVLLKCITLDMFLVIVTSQVMCTSVYSGTSRIAFAWFGPGQVSTMFR